MSAILDLLGDPITDLSSDPIYDLQGSGNGRARSDGRTRILLGRRNGRTLYFRRAPGRDSSLTALTGLLGLRGEMEQRGGINGTGTGGSGITGGGFGEIFGRAPRRTVR